MAQQQDWFSGQEADWFAQQEQGFQQTQIPTPPNVRQAKKGGAIPSAPADKSIGGFVSNVISSGANLVGDTVQGFLGLPRAVYDLASDPAAIPGKAASALPAVGNYLADRYSPSNIGDTLYDDPVGALSDFTTPFSMGSMIPGKVGKAASMIGKYDPADAVVRGGMRGAQAVVGNRPRPVQAAVDTARRVGAAGRNQQYLQETLNPKGYTNQSAASTIKAGQANLPTTEGFIDQTRQQVSKDLRSSLNPQGVSSKDAGMRTQSRVVMRRASENAKIQGQYDKALNTGLGESAYVKHVSPSVQEVGPMFNELHKQRGELLADARATQDRAQRRLLLKQVNEIDGQMAKIGEQSGLTKEYAEYLSANKARREYGRKFENKFIKKLMDTPAEALMDMFVGGNIPSVKSSLSVGAPVQPTSATVRQLGRILGPDMDMLKGGIGERLFEKSRNPLTGISDPKGVSTKLDRLRQRGMDQLVPDLVGTQRTAIKGQRDITMAQDTIPDYIKTSEGLGQLDDPSVVEKVTRSKQLLEHVDKNIPGALEKLRGAIGENLLIDMGKGTSKEFDVAKLESALKEFDKAGVTDILLPQHKTLRQILEVVEDAKRKAYFVGGGGFIRDAVRNVIYRIRMNQPDLQQGVRRLQRSNHPMARKLYDVLVNAAREAAPPAATGERIAEHDDYDIPNPPTAPPQ